MKNLAMLIKPASSNCNLNCKYCFYNDVCKHREKISYGIMKYSVLEKIVEKALSEAEKKCNFAFQGGEPTIAGLDFFKKFIEFVEKYNKKNIDIELSIQTNGTLINKEWASFFKKYDFLVGVSLDGPKDIHDENRITIENKGSFNKVMNNIDLLNKYNVRYNILSVVHKNSCRHIEKIYKFFRKQNFNYLQFIPCLDPIDDIQGEYKYSLTAEDYKVFLNKLFNMWFDDFINGKQVNIRYFDDLLLILLGRFPQSCCMNGFCSCQFVIESDGSVYPCDFYVFEKYKMGFIQEKSFLELFNSKENNDFISSSYEKSDECIDCKWYPICRGGCRRNKEPNFPTNKSNYLCEAYKGFFEENINKLMYIVDLLKK